MDCLTISTFRSLEQQAIRQYKKLHAGENGVRVVSMETFGQEQPASVKAAAQLKQTTNKGLSYYA